MELCHAAEARGQHGAPEALPLTCKAEEGSQAQRESREALREPKCRCQNQTGGTGLFMRRSCSRKGCPFAQINSITLA